MDVELPRLNGAGRAVSGAVAALVLATLIAPARAGENADRAWVSAVYRETCAGDLEGAVAEYESIQARFPDHPRASESLLRSALCREKKGDLQGALRLALRVIAEYPRSAGACSRAEEAQKRLEGRAEEKRVYEGLLADNEALRRKIESLLEQFDKAKASLQKGAEDEAQRRQEIETLQERIDALAREKARLRKNLEERFTKREESRDLSPEELLKWLERDAEAAEREKRAMARHLFNTGLRLQAEGRWADARRNYEKCLELWDEHPDARKQLFQVGSLLGDPESIQKEMLRQLEIRKEIRIQEKKQDLAETFRHAFDRYGEKAWAEAERLFRKALDILVRDLPAGAEFDRQKDLAARYVRLCRNLIREGSGPSSPPPTLTLEIRLSAVSMAHEDLLRFARSRNLHFVPGTGRGTGAPHALLTQALLRDFRKLALGQGRLVLDEKIILAARTPRTLRKFETLDDGKPGPGFSLKLTQSLVGSARRLSLAVNAVLPPTQTLRFPGKEGPLDVEEMLSQHAATDVELPPAGGVLVTGVRNPFRRTRRGDGAQDREDLVIVIEVVE